MAAFASFLTTASSRRMSDSRIGSSSSPVFPKSRRLSRPSGRTKTLPGCGSAWKMPSSKIVCNISSTRVLIAPGIASGWDLPKRSTRSPAENSSVSTVSFERSATTPGIQTSGTSSKAARKSAADRASRVKSSSRCRLVSNSRTADGRSNGRSLGSRLSPSAAKYFSTAMSREMTGSSPGRCTFTATWRPSFIVASCTCAMVAAASGVSPNSENNSVSGAPSRASTVARAVLKSIAGNSSCSSFNSLM